MEKDEIGGEEEEPDNIDRNEVKKKREREIMFK